MDTSNEVFSEGELIAAVEEIQKDERIRSTFDLSDEHIKRLLRVKVTDTGFDISPNFQSSGWGENHSDSLQVNMSDLGNDKAVLKHELKHALHCMVCASLFSGEDAIKQFNEFVVNVVNDPGFYEWRDGATGLVAEDQWERIVEMSANEDITAEDVKKNAVMLGSVLYQHAYFVDPIMCEAVASTNDSGFAAINGKLNRLVGIIIPGDQTIEGYGWKQAQEAFGRAPAEKKALMIRKSEYKRKDYFDF